MKEKGYRESLAYSPDVVIIKLGTNDSKPQNWKYGENFINDAKNLVQSYKALPSKPRIILCKPVPVFETKWGINEKTVRGEIGGMLEKVAISEEVELLNLHIPLRGFKACFPDGIHPNKNGAEIMAQHIYGYLSMPREDSKVIEGGELGGIICDNGVMDFKSWPAGAKAKMGNGRGDSKM